MVLPSQMNNLVLSKAMPLRMPARLPLRMRSKLFCAILILVLSGILSGCNLLGDGAVEEAALASQLLEQRRIAEARLAIGRAIRDRDDIPAYYLLQGRIEMTAGSFAGAYDAYQSALALESTNLEALRGVSQLGLRVGDLRASERAAEQLLSLNPNDIDALLVQGLISLVKGRYADALQNAERILSISTLDEAGTILFARASFLEGDAEEAKGALANYETRVAPSVGSVRTRLEIARAQRNASEIELTFGQLRQLSPDDTQVIVDHANFLSKSGNSSAATDGLRNLLTRDEIPREDLAQAIFVISEYSLQFSSSEIEAIARLGASPVSSGIGKSHDS